MLLILLVFGRTYKKKNFQHKIFPFSFTTNEHFRKLEKYFGVKFTSLKKIWKKKVSNTYFSFFLFVKVPS